VHARQRFGSSVLRNRSRKTCNVKFNILLRKCFQRLKDVVEEKSKPEDNQVQSIFLKKKVRERREKEEREREWKRWKKADRESCKTCTAPNNKKQAQVLLCPTLVWLAAVKFAMIYIGKI